MEVEKKKKRLKTKPKPTATAVGIPGPAIMYFRAASTYPWWHSSGIQSTKAHGDAVIPPPNDSNQFKFNTRAKENLKQLCAYEEAGVQVLRDLRRLSLFEAVTAHVPQ